MIWQQLSEGERQAAVHTTAVGKNIDDSQHFPRL